MGTEGAKAEKSAAVREKRIWLGVLSLLMLMGLLLAFRIKI
jgi:hypothetical protein